MFDALLHRGERRKAARRYREGLEWLTPESTVDEYEAAREAAAERAGEHLTTRRRKEIEEEVERNLSIESAKLYGEELVDLPLADVVDGSWRVRTDELAQRWRQWLRPQHRADQHWQVAEAVMQRALAGPRVDDETMAALDEFLAEIDPEGPSTKDDPWYERFATARLEAGLLPRPRGEARLIATGDETVILTEPGTVLELVTETDGTGRTSERTEAREVRIDASDQRIAVFGDGLLFATAWKDVVGVTTGEDQHDTYVQLDDAAARATHIVHTPMAEYVATLSRELHRRAES